MLDRKNLWIVALPLLLAGFSLGLIQLFQLRFEAGDVYPPYSSLRSDPLGTKAFYQSLEALPSFSVQRNYLPLFKLRETSASTLLILGMSRRDFRILSQDEISDWKKFVIGGGRLVLSFNPKPERSHDRAYPKADPKEEQKGWREGSEESEESERKGDAERDGKDKTRDASQSKENKSKNHEPEKVSKEWGFELAEAEWGAVSDSSSISSVAFRKTNDGLNERVSWHSPLFFDKLDPAWQVVYACDEHPVIIERRIGKGSLMLASDSYFLSNEAMRNERRAELLVWILGSKKRIIFDEGHHGLLEEPGIANLIRKYRLHGLVAGFLLLAVLFIWKNAVSLVPPSEDNPSEGAEDLALGKDAEAGFINLLRRNLAPSDLLSVCFQEWKKSFGHLEGQSKSEADRIQEAIARYEALSTKERNPLITYNAISQILAERKQNGTYKHR